MVDFRVFKDDAFNALKAKNTFTMPKVGTITSLPVAEKGSLAYETSTDTVYLSDGLTWIAIAGKLYPDIAIIKDNKPAGTNGGTNTAGSWEKRDLNTIEGNTTGFVTDLTASEFTLAPGIYDIFASAPHNTDTFFSSEHRIRLFDVTNSVIEKRGTSEQANFPGCQTRSFIEHHLTISSATKYRLQHRTSNTNATDGFGEASGFGGAETYSLIKITKLN